MKNMRSNCSRNSRTSQVFCEIPDKYLILKKRRDYFTDNSDLIDKNFKPQPQEELINYPKGFMYPKKGPRIITSDDFGNLRWTLKKLIMEEDTEFLICEFIG